MEWSLGETGYIKFNNGFLMEWGKYNNKTQTTVNFPMTFSSIFSIVSEIALKAESGCPMYRLPYNITTSGFTTTKGTSDCYCYWIAIGII